MSEIDPCECVELYNHERAMQRLMNMLRDSQNACTDSGCDDLSNDPSSPGVTSSYMMMMLGCVLLATIFYMLRPRSLRNHGDEKPSSSRDGSGSPPPPPGPSVH